MPARKSKQHRQDNNHPAPAQVIQWIAGLESSSRSTRGESIQLLYRTGEHFPELLADHIEVFRKLLTHTDNRMIWGGMSALDRVCAVRAAAIFQILPDILDAAGKGSVITRDNAVSILTRLARHAGYTETALPLLLEQMRNCPTNQLAMYAENAREIITKNYLQEFRQLLQLRLAHVDRDTMKRRIEKVIRLTQK